MEIPLIRTRAALIGALLLPVTAAFAGGPLVPAAAPGVIWKTLNEVEPRTPIESLPFTISAPGSYYLATNNLTGTSGNSGITISANNVTLDLMGFTLAGATGSTHGIYVPAPQMNIIIRNGILVNWPGFGINAGNASDCQISQVNVFSNGIGGLTVGVGSIIDHCTASSNGPSFTISPNGAVGITASSNAIIKDCLASFNNSNGFTAGDNSMIINCTATQNNSFFDGDGIAAGNNCTIIGCAANGNNLPVGPNVSGIGTKSSCLIKDCTANQNGNGIGISTGTYCKIRDCTAVGNIGPTAGGDGISAGDYSAISGCMVSGNEFAGISVGNSCSVVDNTCIGNAEIGSYDIYCSGSGNTVIRNTVTTSSEINAGANNLIGTIVTSSSTMNSSVNPHANFASP